MIKKLTKNKQFYDENLNETYEIQVCNFNLKMYVSKMNFAHIQFIVRSSKPFDEK